MNEKLATAMAAVTVAEIPMKPGSHQAIVRAYPDDLIEDIIADLGRYNLRDLRDHETRWKAERLSAARAERRRRKNSTTTKP
jgi:hypothetical protein